MGIHSSGDGDISGRGICILILQSVYQIPIPLQEFRYPAIDLHIQIPGFAKHEQAISYTEENELGTGLRHACDGLADGTVQQFKIGFREQDGDRCCVGVHGRIYRG